jgi:predicted DCC family thiol-disulfide oxidoreductase YuxK
MFCAGSPALLHRERRASNGRPMTTPTKPQVYYDGECEMCQTWAKRCRTMTGDAVGYTPLQGLDEAARRSAPGSVDDGVRLIDETGRSFVGADAVLQLLSRTRRWRWLWWLSRRVPGALPVSRAIYRVVARHRHRL